MNAALKQRLIGAAVLVALAVIFLPMFLDGAGTQQDIAHEIAIPDRPEIPEPDLDSVPDPVEPPEEPIEQAPDLVPNVTSNQDGTAGANSGREEPPTQEVDQQGEQSADEQGEDDSPAQQSGGSTNPAATPHAWAVQTGSFTRQENAHGQRDRLRDEGFSAFVAEAYIDGRRIWRVRIGPLGTRENAQDKIDRLQAELELTGIIVTHP